MRNIKHFTSVYREPAQQLQIPLLPVDCLPAQRVEPLGVDRSLLACASVPMEKNKYILYRSIHTEIWFYFFTPKTLKFLGHVHFTNETKHNGNFSRLVLFTNILTLMHKQLDTEQPRIDHANTVA